MPYPARIDPDRLGRNALEVVEARGWDTWSLRDVARSLGVSVNALYRYVDDREDLVVAVGEAAALDLGARLADAEGDGVVRLIDLAHRYIAFSVERPHAFSAFVHAKPPPEDPRVSAWFSVIREVRREMEALLPEAIVASTFAYMALLRGRAEMARGPTKTADPTDGLADAVRALVLGYQQLGPVASPLLPYLTRSGTSADPDG